MPKSSNKPGGSTVVLWLAGMVPLGYYFKEIVAEITIWGLLGVVFLWSVFWIRES